MVHDIKISIPVSILTESASKSEISNADILNLSWSHDGKLFTNLIFF